MHRFVTANGIRLHLVEEGAGPVVLLLHGFPDFWYSWRNQIPALASAGFRVVAADLRGYNRSERPEGVDSYTVDVLAEDVAALAASLGGEPPVVVGHDWGGVVGWHLAMHHPDRLRRLIVLNAPHPVAFRRELRRPSTQLLRSSYGLFFQLPRLPEALLSAGGFALLKRTLRSGPARTDAELDAYLAALTAPGALTAALNYYRAAARRPRRGPRPIRVPTLLLWGDRDPFLRAELTRGLEPWVEDLTVTHLPDAAHWMHVTHAAAVNQRILEFARRG